MARTAAEKNTAIDYINRDIVNVKTELQTLSKLIRDGNGQPSIMQQVAGARSAGAPITKALAGTTSKKAATATLTGGLAVDASADAAVDWTKKENKEMLLRKVISEELRKQSRRALRR